MSATRSPGAEWDVDESAAAGFDATIGEWRCDHCGTDFEITGVFASEAAGPRCPVCPAGGEHLTRVGGEGE